jgi:hypothetical protein
MISISNADRDKAVEYLKAYAVAMEERGIRSNKEYNKKRMALNLAKKLERKQPQTLTDSKSLFSKE